MKPRSLRCMKFFLILVNMLLIFFGLVLVIICVANVTSNQSRSAGMSSLSRGVFVFIVTTSSALVMVATMGIIGTLRGHVNMLSVHVCFFIFLVTVQLIVAVGGTVISVRDGGGSDLRMKFYRNFTNEIEISRHYAYWDKIQSENECCGFDGPQDYSILHRDIPPSCCVRAYGLREGGARRQLHAACLSDRTYYTPGCEEVLRQLNAMKSNILIWTGVVVTFFEITSVVLAVTLVNYIRMERREIQHTLQAHFES